MVGRKISNVTFVGFISESMEKKPSCLKRKCGRGCGGS